ncbi:hypothetical protein JXJ21_17745 [candidate division KSB1 bacterium]|nr:hypothetical protein [candidate division KSB1 bacterium]
MQCKFDEYLADFVANELPTGMVAEIDSHLPGCKSCQSRLQELRELHYILNSTPREAPTDAFLKSYHQNLKKMFQAKSLSGQLIEKLADYWHFIITQQAVSFRIAKAAALLLIGFALGWMVFNLQTEPGAIVRQPEILTVPPYTETAEMVKNYIFETEVILLQIVNIDRDDNLEPEQVILAKEVAQKLLTRAFVLHERALQLNDQSVLRYLTQIELILLEISNLNAEPANDAVKEIIQMIKDSNLLYESRNLQELLAQPKAGISA